MTSIDPNFIETLLHMAESDVLDFKRDQYPFVGATDEQKGEIVKDILAFANAWKTAGAHVVIGADENPGGRAVVVGVGGHLDDANLQQLVNMKTNRPVSFEYIPFTFEGKALGIIRIKAEQQRPIFLGRAFGKLKPSVVYVRRGSSTAEAPLEEIERMWAATMSRAQKPEIALELADPVERKVFGTSYGITSRLLAEPPRSPVDKLTNSTDRMRAGILPSARDIAELAAYRCEMALFVRLGLRARNIGSVLIDDARVVIEVPDLDDLVLVDELPRRPQPGLFVRSIGARVRRAVQTTITDAKGHWEIEARLSKIQPGADAWSAPFWIGSAAPTELSLVARVFGDNIGTPVEVPLAINIAVEEGCLENEGTDELEE